MCLMGQNKIKFLLSMCGTSVLAVREDSNGDRLAYELETV